VSTVGAFVGGFDGGGVGGGVVGGLVGLGVIVGCDEEVGGGVVSEAAGSSSAAPSVVADVATSSRVRVIHPINLRP